MADCFERDLLRKKVPFTPEQRMAIVKLLREDYMDHGVPFEKAVRALGNRLGWYPEALIQAVTGPKREPNLRRLTSAMFAREAARRDAQIAAQRLMTDADTSRAVVAIEKLWNAPRTLSVFGHYGVFPGTHMKESLMIPTEWPNFAKAYASAVGLTRLNYKAFHEYQRFKMEVHPDYGEWMKAGLDIHLGSELGGFGGRSAAAFDYIKRARLEIADRWGSHLDLEEKKILAPFINHATGSVKLGQNTGTWLGRFLFAPKLLPAQLKTAFADPVKMVGLYMKGGRATPGQKAARSFVFRRMGQLAAMQTAILGSNYVYGQMTGNPNWQPNLTDPKKADWLRIKIANHVFTISPTLEWLKFPVRLAAHMIQRPTLDTAFKDIGMQFLYHSNPMISNIGSLLLGQELFSGKPLPFRGAFHTPQGTEQRPQEDWREFLGQRMPIPIAAGVRDFYDSMIQEGVDHPTAKSWVDFIVSSAIAQTGYHEHLAYHPPQQKPTRHKKTAAEKEEEKGWLQRLIE